MWGSRAADATRWRGPPGTAAKSARSGLLPGLERADFPVALLLPAGFALHPGLRLVAHEACQKIAARLSVLRVSRGSGGAGPARSGARILPRHAGVFLAPAENRGGGSACIGEVGIRRQLGDVPGTGRRRDGRRLILFAAEK